MLLAPTQQNDRQAHDDDELESSHGPRVPDAVRERMLDLSGGRGQEDSELISEPGHQAADTVRRELVQVYGDDAPRTLHAGLHQKGTESQDGELRSEGPHG